MSKVMKTYLVEWITRIDGRYIHAEVLALSTPSTVDHALSNPGDD